MPVRPPGPPAAELLAAAPPRFTGTLPLWYQLAQTLRTAILGVDHQGATRLPTEVQFAQHYGVSLTTVRQALGSLAATCECLRDPQTSTYVGFRARKAGAYESPLLADRSYL